MSILEDLWYGNLRPCDEPHPQDSAARLLQTQVSELEDALCETFTEAMAMVSTGFISTSIRDAELNGVHIECGDYIGFVGKEMMVSCKNKVEAAKELLEKMGAADSYIVTAFAGHEAEEAEIAELEAWIGETYPDVEFYTTNGGQDVYPFIFVVE